jgi:hypothetical protein
MVLRKSPIYVLGSRAPVFGARMLIIPIHQPIIDKIMYTNKTQLFRDWHGARQYVGISLHMYIQITCQNPFLFIQGGSESVNPSKSEDYSFHH